MKKQIALYFDMYRKANFKKLIKVYTKSAEKFPLKDEIRLNLGTYLLNYFGDMGEYDGTVDKWNSTYTLGRELAVWLDYDDQQGYLLSPLAKSVLQSSITLEEYLQIYLINFNQLINDQIVHPLKEVLKVFQTKSEISKEDIKRISAFNLQVKSEKNQNQLANILLNRLEEAQIIHEVRVENRQSIYKLSEIYSIDTLLNNIYEFEGDVEDYINMSHKQYVLMLSKPTNLIESYNSSEVFYENYR